MSPIRIVIADDHQMMLDGLTTALDSLPDINVVGTATDGSMLAAVVAAHSPDVLLVDVEMPGTSGLAAIKPRNISAQPRRPEPSVSSRRACPFRISQPPYVQSTIARSSLMHRISLRSLAAIERLNSHTGPRL